MNGKHITDVNKVVTNDLDVTGQIDMKVKKIINLGDGTKNGDAVNKAQLDAVESQVTTVNNKVTQNKTDIATMGYYYFTDQLNTTTAIQSNFQQYQIITLIQQIIIQNF